MSFIFSFSSFFFCLRGALARIAFKTRRESEVFGLLISQFETLFAAWQNGTLEQTPADFIGEAETPRRASKALPRPSSNPKSTSAPARKTRRSSIRPSAPRPGITRPIAARSAIHAIIPAQEPRPKRHAPFPPQIFFSSA
jgi:hypothetical protein